MNRWLGLGLLLITVGALALRSPQPGLRPMHNDEGVNAVLVQKLWQDGVYKYNPDEFHGPSLHYATLPFITLSGATDVTQIGETILRRVTIFFGVAAIILIWLMADGLGRATLPAAILFALSPAMVFYSRYYIHEMLLVGFTQLTLCAGWRYSRTRHVGWAMGCGLGLGLMYATKETFVFALFAMFLALGLTVLWMRTARVVREPFYWRPKHIIFGLLCAAVVSGILFTSFFQNPGGWWDSVKTYLVWAQRSGNSPHAHPWYYYFQRLFWFRAANGPFWTEGLILVLALIGALAAFTNRKLGSVHPGLARFLAIYTIVLATVYSAISYKTPWCMLGFFQGMILLAGIGVVALFNLSKAWPYKMVVALSLLAATTHLGWEAWRANYGVTRDEKLLAADNRNPYTYSQTLPNILELVQHVQGVSKLHPDGANMLISVIAPDSDYWPLPFYLRGFKKIGYWDHMTEEPYAPVMIVSSQYKAALDEKTDRKWFFAGYYELRPKVFFELYVPFDLWKNYVENRPRPKDE